ncbi:hypothetical protein [Neobacillus massiliamazoniensis]|uniref:Lipoprotein, putative n=1 Tax=Neobacillus massiliamazoniensis TaxID=1499688 RepID=A0A0U1NYA0_9BACI|nr:hypothetical protein [Neobacillus massiliamazoniensis]CRK82963.1 lipoprotein, putative [Neobacillus massiliamazoniensis]
MKRYIMPLGLILLFTLLTACSSKSSLELVNSKADIVNDKNKVGAIGITEGDKKGQELVPTVLYYEFEIKNNGHKKIGGIGKGLQVKIEPSDKLVAISKETAGFNIFKPSSYDGTGVGYGTSFDGEIYPNKNGKYILTFDLGVSEENPQVPLIVPSKEKLNKLKDNALDASLIVTLDGIEITRFNLKKK